MLDKRKIVFSPEELRIADKKPGFFGRPDTPLFATPISYRDNYNALYWGKEPMWVPTFSDTSGIMSDLYSKNFSRPGADNDGMIDAFGMKWQWVPSAGGAITAGGNPIFTNANEWKEKLVIPDIDSWDWAADAAAHPADTRFSTCFTMLNGFWFERLISLMDFVNAAVALIDDEQQDAVAEIFEALTDLGIKIIDKICYYWPNVDGFSVHDDWGSQRSPFFSEDIARRLFLPYMKELVSHAHSKGRYMGIHSCGHVESRVNIFIEAGLDSWQMQNMNDIRKLYKDFGDKIVFEVWPEEFNQDDEKAAVAAARDFVDYFCEPKKPVCIGYMGGAALGNRVFMEELYSYSRKHYLNQ